MKALMISAVARVGGRQTEQMTTQTLLPPTDSYQLTAGPLTFILLFVLHNVHNVCKFSTVFLFFYFFYFFLRLIKY